MLKSILRREYKESNKQKKRLEKNLRVQNGDWYVNLAVKPKRMSPIQEIIWMDTLCRESVLTDPIE